MKRGWRRKFRICQNRISKFRQVHVSRDCCVKNDYNASGARALYERLQNTNCPLRLITFRYESRDADPRSYPARGDRDDATTPSPPANSERTTWRTRARTPHYSYLRIDVSLNTLFIFVRYIPRRSSPPRGEARSTGTTTSARPRGYDISRHIKTSGGAHAHASAAAVAIVLVNRHVGGRGGISPPDSRALLHIFFFMPAREKLAWRQCRPGIITRVSDLKGHPSSRPYTTPHPVASNIIIMPSARPLCDAINARDETPARFAPYRRARLTNNVRA